MTAVHTKLGEICIVRRGTTITKKQTIEGEVPVIGGGTKPTYFHNESNRKANCITISGSGASAGFVNKWDVPIFASDCSTVEPKDNTQLSNFIYYFLLSQQEYIYKNFRSGAAQPHVYAKDIASLEYPILPIAEQERIVAKLDATFAEIDRAAEWAQIKENEIQKLKASLLNISLSSDAVANETLKLGDLCDVITKGTTPTSVGFKFESDGINFIKVESLTSNNGFIPARFAKISTDCNDSLKRSQLQKGDILFSIAGALGRTAVVTEDILPANTNQALAIIRLKFLLYLLNSDTVRAQSERNKGGVAQQNLSLTQLKNYDVYLPSFTEQQQIVARLDTAFNELENANEALKKSKLNYSSLKAAILIKELQSSEAA